MKNIKYFFLALFFGVALNAFSQERQQVWRFENFNSEYGLSNEWVNDITEDHRGFLWLGTRSGLNIFDGKNFEVIKNDASNENSLSSNDVSCVMYHDSLILAGTWGRGLNAIDPLTKQVTRIGEGDSILSYLTIKNFTLGPDSLIYICTYGNGIYKYNPKNGDFLKIQSSLQNERILFDYCEAVHLFEEQIWVGLSKDGLGRVNSDGELELIEIDSTQFGKIRHITVLYDDGEDLLIGTHFGEVYRMNPKNGHIINRYLIMDQLGVKSRVTSLIIDENKRFWVSTSSGLFILDKKTGLKTRVVSESQVSDYNNEFCSFIDSRGVLWFGSWGNGVDKYYEGSHKFDEINLSKFPTSTKKCIYELDNNSLLIGTSYGLIKYNKTLNIASRPTFKGEHAKNLSENIILGFAKYKDKVLVAVDAAGLYLIDSAFHVTEFIRINDKLLNHTFINNVHTTTNGDIWVSTWSNGLLHIDPKHNDINHYLSFDNSKESINSNLVHCVFESTDGTYWVGTKEGINSFYKSQSLFKSPGLTIDQTDRTFFVKDVKSIAEDEDGKLWMSSSLGLVRWDREANETRLFTEDNGLVDHDFTGILVRGRYLWGASKSGLVKMNTKDFSVSNYTTKDGLLSNSFVENSLNLASDSILYMGNGHGMIFFNFNESKKKEFVDHIFISGVKINRTLAYDTKGAHVSTVNEVNVPFKHNSLLFNVTTQNFGIKKAHLFSHKLEGFQESWILHKQGQDEVSYTNLPYGEYVLRLSAVNSDSDKVGEELRIKIRIEKPFWRNWWFLAGLILLFGLMLYLFFKWRNKAIISQNVVLEKSISDRTSTLSKRNDELKQAYADLKNREESLEQNILYASILQKALKPSGFDLARSLGDHFIMERSQTLVSGDFHWATKVNGKRVVVVADCSGRGVAGSYLSVIAVISLRNIVVNKGITKPDIILNELHDEISSIFNAEENTISESINVSVVVFDQNTKLLSIASAKAKPVIINDKGEHLVMKGSRFSVGSCILPAENREPYFSFEIQVEGRYMVYLFTDGYQNQFGGDEVKKFMAHNLRKLFTKQYFKQPKDQKKLFEYTFDKWKKDNPLTDDVLLIGLEFNG